MKTKIYLSVFLLAVLSGCGNRLLREADMHYAHYEFATAAQQYENFLKTESDTSAMLRLADCYRQMNRHKEAVNWYAKSITSSKATSADQLHYAQSLRSTGDNQQAELWFDNYLKTNPTDTVAHMQKSSCTVSEVSDIFYDVEATPIVTNSSCFSPYIYNGKVYFSMEAPKEPGVAANPWTGHGFLDLYAADPSDLNKSVPLDSGINSVLHESNVVFTADGKTAYFTRSSMKEIKSRRKSSFEPASAADNDNHIEICSAQLVDGKWSNVSVLPFNNTDYSCGHPALASNDQRMYFTSDMPGGHGGTDIYYVDYINGQWSAPANAGVAVNTTANEMFPVITKRERTEDLYFSSNGWMGYGGLDIYQSSLISGLPYVLKHLPAPFNSKGDDFGITFNADMNSGYFSTNRDNEEGDDRIYRFSRKSPVFFMNLTVLDKETQQPVVNTEVEITNARTNYTWKANTDADGKLIYGADSLTTYGFKLMCNNYFCGFNNASVGGFRGKFMDTTYATINLEKIVINKPIRLDNIYYDYNKWNIRPDAAVELDKLVKIMLDNPKIKIELSSHTDSRGSDKYNMTLSQKRAQSAVDYIVSKGVNKDRIYAKGYGESKTLNRCTNGVKCTEEEFQWNRRTEFKVVEIVQ